MVDMYFSMFVFLCVLTGPTSSDKCTHRPVDIVFILDESGSVGVDNFQHAKNFLKLFVDDVEIGRQSGFQISVVTFGTDAVIQFHFNKFNTQTALKETIGNIPYRGGGTNTAAGLDIATKFVFTEANGSRTLGDIAKYAVVLTDGQSTLENTIAAANRLKNKVDKLFAVGVGPGVDPIELESMASKTDAYTPRTVFSVPSFENLQTILDQVVHITCYGVDASVDACRDKPCCAHGKCVHGIDTYNCRCDAGYIGKRCQHWRPCTLRPCQNGATCEMEPKSGTYSTDKCELGYTDYVCQCVPGYEGRNCTLDINECESSPCQNGGTCNNLLNMYTCICTQEFYGDRCERDICRPRPADLFFLLDSSASQTNETFKVQLDFVSNIIDQVDIGEDDFLVSVITFSFSAHVEFALKDNLDRNAVKKALEKIKLKPGPTNTAAALNKVIEVSDSGQRPLSGGRPEKIVVVITDGMSTYRQETEKAAKDLSEHVDRIITIGVGPAVSQEELLSISSEPDTFSQTNVFSVNHSDSLNTILSQLVFHTCQKCYRSSKSDVVFLVDSSVSVNIDQFGIFKDAMLKIVSISNVGIENEDTVFSAFTFTNHVRQQFDFKANMNSSQDAIKTAIAKIKYDGGNTGKYDVKSNLSNAVSFAQENVFAPVNGARDGSRKFLILFVNGNDITFDRDILERARSKLHNMEVSVVVFAEGDTPDLYLLKSIPSDPYFLFVHTSDSNLKTLDTLSSEFTYNVCDLD